MAEPREGSTSEIAPATPTIPELLRLAFVLLIAAIVGLTVFGFRATRPAVPALDFPTAMATNDFPGLDAYSQLQNIAQIPHPMYSAENIRIYNFLVATVNAYRSNSSVPMSVIELGGGSQFSANNAIQQLMVFFPGTTSSTVLVSAHFDSVPASPGASDDGAAITVMLQIARIMSMASVTPRNSLLLFFNNGEEMGLQGSSFLLQSAKYASYISNTKVFVNLEGGGAGGKPILFRTTTAALAQAWANLPYPHMNSFGGDILGALGSFTDYQNYYAAGIPGFDVAYYENRRFYHTSQDTLDNISPTDVQYMGNNVLALTRTLLNATWIDDLEIEAAKVAFFDYFGGYWPVVISFEFRMTLLAVLAVGLVASVAFGVVFYKRHSFPSNDLEAIPRGNQVQSTPKLDRFKKSIATHVTSSVLVYFFSLCWSLAFCALVCGVSFATPNSSKTFWTIIPLLFIGCIAGGYHASRPWSRQLYSHDNRTTFVQDTQGQLLAGVVLGTLIAAVFTAGNWPLMYILAIGALARLVCVAALNIRSPRQNAPIAFKMAPNTSVLVFGTILVIASVYPLLMLADFVVIISRMTVGNLYMVLLFVLMSFPLGGAMMSVMVHVRTEGARKLVWRGCVGLVGAFSVWMVVGMFV
ncbi:hypothetical protein HDU98_010190 [Podochytrium sp. JEL0797]|nr:hypothetical protein HDU98_010190 [Podochytrium sp. JEL0797]